MENAEEDDLTGFSENRGLITGQIYCTTMCIRITRCAQRLESSHCPFNKRLSAYAINRPCKPRAVHNVVAHTQQTSWPGCDDVAMQYRLKPLSFAVEQHVVLFQQPGHADLQIAFPTRPAHTQSDRASYHRTSSILQTNNSNLKADILSKGRQHAVAARSH